MYKIAINITLSRIIVLTSTFISVMILTMLIAMIYPSTLLASKYALYALYHLFALCSGIRMLMEDDDSPAVAMPIPSRIVATSYPTKPKAKPRTRRSKLCGHRNNKALLGILRNGANEGNGTS